MIDHGYIFPCGWYSFQYHFDVIDSFERSHLQIIHYTSSQSMQNLYERIQRMKEVIGDDTLLFCDITWGAGGSTSQLSMDIAIYMQQQLNITTNLHMTCTNMIAPTPADGAAAVEPIEPKKVIQNSIQTAIQHDVINIFALRGDPPVNADGSHSSTFVPIKDGFTCALDLVKFIRHPDTILDGITNNTTQIGVGVAGYPEGHPVAITVVDDVSTMTESEKARSSYDYATQTTYTCRDADYEKELIYLKEKVDAGAEFIVSPGLTERLGHAAREAGVPFLPGIANAGDIMLGLDLGLTHFKFLDRKSVV